MNLLAIIFTISSFHNVPIDTIYPERQEFWKQVALQYADSIPNKSTIENFCKKALLVHSKDKIHSMSFKYRKRLLYRTMQVCRAETTYGRYGIGKTMNNVVGRKIHGNFYKWGAVRARQNNAKFTHWTYSILFYYEKMLHHRNTYHRRNVC